MNSTVELTISLLRWLHSNCAYGKSEMIADLVETAARTIFHCNQEEDSLREKQRKTKVNNQRMHLGQKLIQLH